MAELSYVSLDEIQKPKNGYEVWVDYWWIVDPEKGAIFSHRWRGAYGAPQCNRDENVTRLIHSSLYKDMEVHKIPLAYIKRDYD